MKEKGFRLAQSNGQKKWFRYGNFALEKKGQEHGANLGLPIESKKFRAKKVAQMRFVVRPTRGGLLPPRGHYNHYLALLFRCCSSNYLPFFPPSTPSFDPQKKKPFRFSLLPLFGWPHHSFLSSASLLFPSRRGNPLLWHRLLMVPGGVSNIERKKSLRAGFRRTLKQRNRTIRFGTNSDR